MKARKKRLLWCGEATFLSTGFAVYGHEILSRLHATGKYEIMELANYGPPGDPRAEKIPWKYKTVMPNPNSQKEVEMYNSNPLNQFGEWKFEETCLEFEPDIVFEALDPWMSEHHQRSVFRPFYYKCTMPTVDAFPQDEQWIATFVDADTVLTYSDWALGVLRKQGGKKINLVGSASPAADYGVFEPHQDRKGSRRSMGLDENCFIVGTTMRNQKRKLFPDLIEAFASFLEKAPVEISSKTFLYLHTSWPDNGWDIPRLILEAGIGHKVLMTYICRSCSAAYPSFFGDARAICRKCGAPSATLSNTHFGVSREVLASVMNLFDVYVQYSNSEGLGMPQIEAAACGVPVMSVDYSAMSDVVRKLGGTPIKVQRFVRESETHCFRAYPDNDDLVSQLISFFSDPEPVRLRRGHAASIAARFNYSYDLAAGKWEECFEQLPVRDGLWQSPARTVLPASEMPRGMSDEQFVDWGFRNVAGMPWMCGSYVAMKMVRDLNWNVSLPHMGGVYFNDSSTLGVQVKFQRFEREDALEQMKKMAEKLNFWEGLRLGKSASPK